MAHALLRAVSTILSTHPGLQRPPTSHKDSVALQVGHGFSLPTARFTLPTYRRAGLYEYEGGVNMKAVVALVSGAVVALMGLVVPRLRWLYDYAWFIGFGVSGAVYVLLMQRAEAPAWEREG